MGTCSTGTTGQLGNLLFFLVQLLYYNFWFAKTTAILGHWVNWEVTQERTPALLIHRVNLDFLPERAPTLLGLEHYWYGTSAHQGVLLYWCTWPTGTSGQ